MKNKLVFLLMVSMLAFIACRRTGEIIVEDYEDEPAVMAVDTAPLEVNPPPVEVLPDTEPIVGAVREPPLRVDTETPPVEILEDIIEIPVITAPATETPPLPSKIKSITGEITIQDTLYYFDYPDSSLKYRTMSRGDTCLVLVENEWWIPAQLASGNVVWIYKGKIKQPEKPAAKPPVKPPLPEKPVEKQKPPKKEAPKIPYPVITNRAFSAGETLQYKISYIGFTAGHTTLGVTAGQMINNRPTLLIRMYTESISLFWFKVRDTLESHIDKAGLFTYKYAKHLRQGQKVRDEVIEFDPVKGSAQRTKNNETNPAVKTEPFISDVLGSLYNLRTFDLEIGKSRVIPIFDGKTSYDLRVDVIKRETISVPAGKFKTIMVIPRLQSAGIFMEKGNMEVWLTDDHLKLPVLIKAKIPIGSFVGKLVEYQLGVDQR